MAGNAVDQLTSCVSKRGDAGFDGARARVREGGREFDYRCPLIITCKTLDYATHL